MKKSDNSRTSSEEGPHLPECEISLVLGLIELLKAKGGQEDIYKLATELGLEYGKTLAVIHGAELLQFVHTPGGDVVLEALGQKVTRSKIADKKAIIRDQLVKIPVFQKINSFLKTLDNHEASKDEVMEKLTELMPDENPEEAFQNLVDWGRYSELFGYNDDSQTFYMDIAK